MDQLFTGDHSVVNQVQPTFATAVTPDAVETMGMPVVNKPTAVAGASGIPTWAWVVGGLAVSGIVIYAVVR